ncbi:hypothetical protein PsorP6_002752 [Peronosclerospora sorghi]|uniref:Uncharacterized protein n=1 Tax=Peronosclerospora sorghi TaxID=230839 RepID=A0ACC0WP07_9STRA|nr:hypothetical protein PsorP6_002752 [Peronosclerospora sorghi]
MARWFQSKTLLYLKAMLDNAQSKRPNYDPKAKNEEMDVVCRSNEDVRAIAVQATTKMRDEIFGG